MQLHSWGLGFRAICSSRWRGGGSRRGSVEQLFTAGSAVTGLASAIGGTRDRGARPGLRACVVGVTKLECYSGATDARRRCSLPPPVSGSWITASPGWPGEPNQDPSSTIDGAVRGRSWLIYFPSSSSIRTMAGVEQRAPEARRQTLRLPDSQTLRRLPGWAASAGAER